MAKGKLVIKGLAYNDLIAILTTNGYDVEVKAESTSNATKNTYVIKYKSHDYSEDCINAC